jgi:hypothetical protein
MAQYDNYSYIKRHVIINSAFLIRAYMNKNSNKKSNYLIGYFKLLVEFFLITQ